MALNCCLPSLLVSTAIGSFLCPPGFAGPRGLGALVREGSALPEALRGARHSRELRNARRARPYVYPGRAVATQPVLLVPGFMAGDWSLIRLASYLRHHDYRTYRSDISVNIGCTAEAADRLEQRLEAIAARRGQKVTIVGHSLGGMLARGLAVRRPDLVDSIVTMGSPVLAPGAVHEALQLQTRLLTVLTKAGFGGMMSADCVAGPCARASWEESRRPLADGVGFTAIYSKRDGIVDWRSCVDPIALPVEVRTSHCGMAVDPVVFDHVLYALREHRLTQATRAAGRPGAAGRLHAVNR